MGVLAEEAGSPVTSSCRRFGTRSDIGDNPSKAIQLMPSIGALGPVTLNKPVCTEESSKRPNIMDKGQQKLIQSCSSTMCLIAFDSNGQQKQCLDHHCRVA